MTRETKIGLVVASSFLLVMGGLVAKKFYSEGNPSTEPNGIAPSDLPQPVAALPSGNASPATPPPGVENNLSPAPVNVNNQAPVNAAGPASLSNEPAMPVAAPVAAQPQESAGPNSLLPPPQDMPKPAEQQPNTPPQQQQPSAPAMEPQPPAKEPEATKPVEVSPQPEFKAVEQQPPPEKKPEPPPKQELLQPVVDPPKAPTAKLENRPTIPAPKTLPDSMNTQQVGGPKAAVPPAPANDSYLEEEYRAQAGDTFASISKRFYHDEKVADALRAYNRDYPIASPAMKRDPNTGLTNGTVVWIPPMRILDKRYPGMMPEMPGKTATNTANTTSTAAAPAAITPASTAPRAYKVRDGGESMQDIAKRKLPSQDWQAIYRLNPMLNQNPAVPIPAGTMLRLPPEANTD